MKICEVLAFRRQRGFRKWLDSWQRPQLWKQLELSKVWKSQLFMSPCIWSCHPTAERAEDVGWMSPSADSVLCSSSPEATKCSPKWGVFMSSVWMQKAAAVCNHTSYRPAGTFHCALHHSRISEKDVLMVPTKWIKVLLDSIASPVSKLALGHTLQLITDVRGFCSFAKSTCATKLLLCYLEEAFGCCHQITANLCMVRAVKAWYRRGLRWN